MTELIAHNLNALENIIGYNIKSGIPLFRISSDLNPAVSFYSIIEAAMQKKAETGQAVNAAQHVWGYFKDVATQKEQARFESVLNRYKQGKSALSSVKRQLERMAEKYGQSYLLNSYYFAL